MDSVSLILTGINLATLMIVVNVSVKIGSLNTKVDTMWMSYTRQHRATDADHE